MVRVLVFAFFALSLAATPVMAQESDAARRTELAQRLIAVSQGDNIRKVIEQLVQDQLSELQDGEPEHLEWMRANMPRLAVRMIDQLMPRITALYAEMFTAPELEAQITLFEGPLGQGIANKSVALGVEVARIMGELQAAYMEDLISKFCAEFECSEGQDTAKPSAR